MKFGAVQKINFGTEKGTYSTVTERENYDSQITLTDFETEIALSHFGKNNLHVGNVQSNPAQASKTFRLFPDGNLINLNIVYPKPEKPELRLYISTRAGFKPKGEDIWFLFCKDGDIWIGAMPEAEWRRNAAELKNDDTDEIYQNAVNETDKIRISKLKERDSFTRDRNIALKRMELSGFQCEFNPSHGLFISRFTQKPYLEAHHLVPISFQNEFPKKLDTINNVFCLCPCCHRAVHHAEEPCARDILSTLASKRPILPEYSLKTPDLFSLYSVEEITD